MLVVLMTWSAVKEVETTDFGAALRIGNKVYGSYSNYVVGMSLGNQKNYLFRRVHIFFCCHTRN